VLYNTVEGINCLLEEGRDTTALTYVTAVFKFFATSLGGVVIGIVYGTITSLLTKYTLETRGECNNLLQELLDILCLN